MKFRSTLLADARGSMGGITASRNKGGSYLRARVKPTNPNSEAQQEVRQAFALAVAAWSALTNDQRNGWNAYADQTPVTDSLGEQVKHSGRAWYVAQAAFLTRVGQNTREEAPATPGLGALGEPTGLQISEEDGISAAFTSAAPNAPSILVAIGPPVSPGVLDYHGPYTFAAVTDAANTFTDVPVASGRWGSPQEGEFRPIRFTACDKATGKMYTAFTTIVQVGE
jgi:hypothetical protein